MKSSKLSDHNNRLAASCCCGKHELFLNPISRRSFLRRSGTAVLGSVALSGLSWASMVTNDRENNYSLQRQPLVIKPVLTYETASRKPQTSWRHWGGIQTEQDARDEIIRIKRELEALKSKADFPIQWLPISAVKTFADMNSVGDIQSADLLLIYAAGGETDIFDRLHATGKNIIFFCRHKSGPVYLYYEVLSPFYLRKYTDKPALQGIDDGDVVVDNQDELLWRLRALCGLKNTMASKIISIGGIGAWGYWARPEIIETVAKLVKEKYKLEILCVSFDELGNLIKEARKDERVIADAKKLAAVYLQQTDTRLETKAQFVENCFVLKEIFEKLMQKYQCRTLTVNNCMEAIMPLAETSACLTLSLLNDAGYLAFCESDFVVIPIGILMAHISGKPVFLNDPTYPHDHTITLAHCTAPRRMDGKKLEPARIVTHFESDYGAAPKVEMQLDQTVTNIMPDFEFNRHVGLLGRIADNPFLDICRSQIDIVFECDSKKVAEQMVGFHWITLYGDYLKEAGYALKKIGIRLDVLT